MILSTPFAHVPKNRFMGTQEATSEKTVRLDVKKYGDWSDDEKDDSETKDDSSDASSMSEYYLESSEEEDDASVSSEDSDDQEIIDIEKLMKQSHEKARERLKNVVQASNERMKTKPPPNPFRWVYKKVRARYDRWYERNREARKHPLFRNYEIRVKELNEKLKKDFEDELARAEREVFNEAKRRQKRIKRSAMVKKRGNEELIRFDGEVKRRNDEADRMQFNCVNMQRWAGDNYDRDMAQYAADMEANIVAEKKAHDKAVKDEIEHDNHIIDEDIALTQELYRQMRVSGLKEGVNVHPKAMAKKKQQKKIARTVREITVELKETAAHAFKSWEPKYEQTKRQREGNVFNVNLLTYKFLKKIRGSKLGEKGALSLASDFIRGAAPQLAELDLSYCQIQTRGFIKLLFGIKIANLTSLSRLNVRGNDIGPRGIETLGIMLNLTIFENLAHIDLSSNELGDDGAHKVAHLCLFGQLESMIDLNLNSNLMTDVGFEELVTVFSASQPEKCPNLERISLSGNAVSPAIRAKHSPYPLYIVP